MENIIDFLGNVTQLSTSGLIGSIFTLLGTAGNWADNVAKLLGLLG